MACLICTGDTANECSYCSTGYYLYQTNCSQVCIDGYYGNALYRRCALCESPCVKCESSASRCTSCQVGMYLNTSDSSCQGCQAYCLECSSALTCS